MLQGPRTEELHRLRDTRLALPDETRQKVENEYLRPDKQPTLRVYEWGTQKPVNPHVFRLRLNRESPRFCGSIRLVR